MKHLLAIYIYCLCISHSVYARPSYLLVNAHTGEKLIEENASIPRFPASLTKMMTLYIVFDHLKDGSLHLQDRVVMSTRACRLPSSKLYLKPGTTLSVEEAIKALVVKSANDISLALAERIAGSEYNFATLMNQKAYELGMHKTVFYNPNGLPHRKQVSTAEDMAILARAHLNNHPEFYRFFSEKHFYFNGKRYKNTNGLLGKIDGVDGIKTGYTRAAGWNLVASQQIGPERVVGVVMGEYSPQRRDHMMIFLLNKQVPTPEQIIEAERKVFKKRKKARQTLYKRWTVRTGTFKNKKQADQFIKQLKKNQHSFFHNASHNIINILYGSHKKYTTHVGRFKCRKDAEQLCSAMQEKSLSCYVVKTK